MPDLKYTEEQHVAILTDAVQRETASLSTVKEELEARVEVLSAEKAAADATLSTTQAQLDVLEAEKAAAIQRAEQAEAAHTAYVAELERLAQVEQAKEDRVTAIKAADASLEADYFTDERVQRWAEMADEQFTSLVADLTEAAAKRKPFAAEGDDKDKDADKGAEKARETAAFTGGTAPTAGEGTSVLGGFFQATGQLPVTAKS